MVTAEEFIDSVAERLEGQGYLCDRMRAVEPDAPVLYAERKVRWLLRGRFRVPFRVRYYCYIADDPSGEGELVCKLHRRSWTDVERRYRMPWFLRFVMPVTVTVVVSESGFHPQLMARVREKKTEKQKGHANTIALADLATGDVAMLEKIGIVASLPLARVVKECRRLLEDSVV